MGLALLVGIPAGLGAALARGTPLAPLERIGSSLALSVPAFFLATVLIYVFALRTHLVPTSGWEGWRAKLLPTLTLAAVPTAYCMRLTRAAVLDALEHEYVRTARAKGLRQPRIITVHVLRNALVPVLSAVGPILGALMTTVFVVEYVFAIPGLARHYVSAATADDYPLVLGMTVVITMVVIMANLVVDLLLAALDPRLREPR
jgi:oligopeptide transport system permease protein